MNCPGCQAEAAAGAPCCAACGALLPPGPPGDPFADLGLPRRFDLAPEALEAAYRERARQVHPDRHVRAAPAQRRLALEHAARLNGARRQLQDPLRRAEALLRLAGVDPLAGGGAADAVLPDFLEAQLALRERLAAARAARDRAAGAAVAAEVRACLAALERELAGRFGAGGQPAPEELAGIAGLLRRARFHTALLAEAEAPAGTAGFSGGGA